MSMSMMGLAARPGTEVLPMCSMARMGTAEAVRMVVRDSLISEKEAGQVGSYSDMWIFNMTAV